LREVFDNDPELRRTTLVYVAQDALYTRLLCLKQMDAMSMDRHLSKGMRLLKSYINPLVQAEVDGMTIDMDKIDTNIGECDKIINEIEAKIADDELVNDLWNKDKDKWEEVACELYPKSHLQWHSFDYNKATDLSILLYGLAGAEKEYTEKGQLALDSSTLEHIPFGITDNIIEARQITKIRDTYLDNIRREAVYDQKSEDYILHSIFQLHVAKTFRSSSSGGVNLQNIPAHDDRALNLIKSCIVPPKGMYILGGDYSALEIGIGCSLHHDKNMTAFLLEGGDMHRATTKDIYRLSDSEVEAMGEKAWKELRQRGKRSNFCFFYGGGAKMMSGTLWKDAQHTPSVMELLKGKGIKTFDDFMANMKAMYGRLWTEQFPEYGEWRKQTYAFYQKHGYVNLPAGFRCYGPMTSMQATNSPIQGSAAQLALFAGSHITEEMKAKHMRSFILDYIHDALYVATMDEELEEVLALMKKWMIDEARNKFPWISVPLFVDTERSEYREDGGNWSQEIKVRRLS
jgi:DNA polymerase I-like protein with 3'-5' exonuclease and polymerase domains